jgi:hypothetical protein
MLLFTLLAILSIANSFKTIDAKGAFKISKKIKDKEDHHKAEGQLSWKNYLDRMSQICF